MIGKTSHFVYYFEPSSYHLGVRYRIPSFLYVPEKTELALNNLSSAFNGASAPTLAISFFSASSFPLASPSAVSRGLGWPQSGVGVEGVNGRLARRLMDILSDESGTEISRLCGWALLDYYAEPEPALVPLLVEFNFLGRVI